MRHQATWGVSPSAAFEVGAAGSWSCGCGRATSGASPPGAAWTGACTGRGRASIVRADASGGVEERSRHLRP